MHGLLRFGRLRGWVLAGLVSLAACGGGRDTAEPAATSRVRALAADTMSADALFDWAERAYPNLFPGHEATLDAAPYRYRYYAATGNYVGVAGTQVSVLGPLTGGVVQHVGQLGDFECSVLARRCPVPTEARLWAETGIVVARETSGRFVVWGSNNFLLSNDGVPSADNGTRVMASGGRAFVVNDVGGQWIDAAGAAEFWGSWARPSSTYANRAAGPWKGTARHVANSQVGSFVAVQDDGTAWFYPGPSETVNGATRPVASRIAAPMDVSSIARQTDYFTSRVHFVTTRGSVFVTDASLLENADTFPVPATTEVVSASCTRDTCVALRRDGTVIEWSFPGEHVKPVAGLADIKQISIADSSHWNGGSASVISRAVAIDGSGRLWIGRGRGPEAAAELDNVTDASCNNRYCVVRRADGTVWGWGDGYSSAVKRVLGPDASNDRITRVPGVLIP